MCRQNSNIGVLWRRLVREGVVTGPCSFVVAVVVVVVVVVVAVVVVAVESSGPTKVNN